jgi:hypothetical protein
VEGSQCDACDEFRQEPILEQDSGGASHRQAALARGSLSLAVLVSRRFNRRDPGTSQAELNATITQIKHGA